MVRKHGKALGTRGCVQERVADAAIDLYALLAVLSRATARLEEHGEEAAGRDVTLVKLFAAQAGKRFADNLAWLENSETGLLHAASEVAYQDGGYRLS